MILPIKAITLWQPWASLMAFGEKTLETRSWATRYRGPLAIHAAKSTPKADYAWAMNSVWFQSALNTHGCSFEDLPRSHVVCIVDLIGCFRTEDIHKVSFVLGHAPGMKELHFGNYSSGRYIWVTRLIERIDDSTTIAGSQGLWDWVRGPKNEATRQALIDAALSRGDVSLFEVYERA